MTVKDRERTFASNLVANCTVGWDPANLSDSVMDVGYEGLFCDFGEAPEKHSDPSFGHGNVLRERGIYEDTSSIQLASTPKPRAYFDESLNAVVLLIDSHTSIDRQPSWNEVDPASITGEFSVIRDKIAAGAADSFRRLYTYYASLPDATAVTAASCFRDLYTYYSISLPNAPNPQVEQPHQEAVKWIKVTTGLSWTRVGRLIGATRQAVNRWMQGGPITDARRRRLLEVRDVLERVAKRSPHPGVLAAWLDTPRGADARTPAELLEAGEIKKARFMALSSPSRGVKTPPEWARRGAREAFLNSRERVRALPEEDDDQLLVEASEDEDE